MFSMVRGLVLFTAVVFALHSSFAAKWISVTDIVFPKFDLTSSRWSKRSSNEISVRDLTELKLSEELQITDQELTSEGTIIKRYRETFNGIPVYDAYASLETDKETDEYTGQASGFLLQGINWDINALNNLTKITENEALELAVRNATIEVATYKIDQQVINLLIMEKHGKATLVYDVSFRLVSDGNVSIPGYFIDVHSGVIIRSYSRLKAYRMKSVGGNIKMGKYIYGIDMPYLDVQKYKESCILQNKQVKVFHLENDLDIPESPYTFKCSNKIKDSINGAYSPLSDVFFFGNKIVSMFKDWLHLDPIKNMPISFHVHYGKEEGAYFNPNILAIELGDGDKKNYYPFTSVDVVAHEMAHAFTNDHSGLPMQGQAGGIDESMSDITGEAAEQYVYGMNDFIAGENIYLKKHGRNLCNPVHDGISIDHVDNYITDMNAHYSSGVFNKVACDLTKSGIPLKDVFRIFMFANRFYWHPSSNFTDAGCGVLKAAYDLSYKQDIVKTALQGVGIIPCDIVNHMRMLSEHTTIDDLEAISKDSEIIFKIKFSKFNSSLNRMKISTSGDKGDVDVYVGYHLPVTKYNYIYKSRTKGSYETIYVKRKKMLDGYLVLVPKHSTFSGVKLSVNVY